MADTYAVVQKRRATSGPRSESGACSTEGALLYSHVTPGTRWPQAPTEEGAQLGGGELTGRGEGLGRAAPISFWGPPLLDPLPQADLATTWLLSTCWSRPEVSQAKPQGPRWVRFSGSHLAWAEV